MEETTILYTLLSIMYVTGSFGCWLTLALLANQDEEFDLSRETAVAFALMWPATMTLCLVGFVMTKEK